MSTLADVDEVLQFAALRADAIGIRDRDTRIILVSPNGTAEDYSRQLSGIFCEEIHDQPIYNCEDCAAVECLIRGKRCSKVVVSKSGVHWEVTGYPIEDEAGTIVGVIESRRDVTENQHMAAALRESEEIFRGLADHSPNMIFVNCEGKNVYANARCSEILGYRNDELISRDFDFMTLIAPESQDTVNQSARAHVRGEAVDPYEYTLLTRTGERIEALNATRNVTYKGKSAILVVSTDIRELKRIQLELLEISKRYRTLVEICPDAITVTDLEGNIRVTNHQTAVLHGCSSVEEFLGCYKNAFDLIAPEDRERAAENLKKTLVEGQVRNAEYSALTKNGDRVTVEISASLILDANGKPESFIGVTRDVTARKLAELERQRLEAEYQQTQKLESLGLLAGGIAHDFNNLLTAILGHVSLLLARMPAEGPDRYSAEQIELAATQSAELTQQLLAFAGRANYSMELINISDILREVSNLLKVGISKKIALQMELNDKLPLVYGDASQMRQVIMNLFTNAADAICDRPGTITARTGLVWADAEYLHNTVMADNVEEGQYVTIEVTDTGSGIDEQALARIFDPFFTTKSTGRGLGLAAVMGIVRGHHGAITIETEVDMGTTFRVLLPAEEGTNQRTVNEQPCLLEIGIRGTILVVDDEESVRRAATTMLSALGLRVMTASNGQLGVEMLRKHQKSVDAVLLDMTMPVMNGMEALAEMRKIDPRVRVLLTSGYNETIIEDVLQRESIPFIKKPYRVAELAVKIRELLCNA